MNILLPIIFFAIAISNIGEIKNHFPTGQEVESNASI